MFCFGALQGVGRRFTIPGVRALKALVCWKNLVNEFQSQLTLALIVPFILQWVKRSNSFKWITLESGRLNTIVAATIATLGGLGIAFAFNADTGTLTITGLSIAGIWNGLQHVILQFMMQHTVYRLAIAPPLPGAVQAAKEAAKEPKA